MLPDTSVDGSISRPETMWYSMRRFAAAADIFEIAPRGNWLNAPFVGTKIVYGPGPFRSAATPDVAMSDANSVAPEMCSATVTTLCDARFTTCGVCIAGVVEEADVVVATVVTGDSVVVAAIIVLIR